MRLLHYKTLEFHEFYDNSIPRYAILSHTWGDGEISYQDMCRLQKVEAYQQKRVSADELLLSLGASAMLVGTDHDTTKPLRDSRGYAKIRNTAEVAKREGIQYFWVDTCCIDKSSSSELQEAINSMYRWYQKSDLCLVYLEDVDDMQIGDFGAKLKTCRWIGRGWTLQELIAPRKVAFFDRNWVFVTYKRKVMSALSEATGIPQHILYTRDLSRASVAQKMSWAANRVTTRVEDRAYSLLGLFGVHMALLYGEGENAFLRLQEEILRTTPDDSIFTWQAKELDYSICRGLLARSPGEFRHCGDILQGEPIFTSTSNLGIRLDIEISHLYTAGKHDPLYAGWLRSGTLEGRCYIILRPLLEDDYGVRCVRVMTSTPRTVPDQALHVKTVFVRQKPVIPTGLTSALKYCFHIRRSDNYDLPEGYFIRNAWPAEQFNKVTRQLYIPKTSGRFIGVIFLEPLGELRYASNGPIQLLLGHNNGHDGCVPRAWCKFVCHSWPAFSASESAWKEAIERLGSFEQCGTAAAVKVKPPIATEHDVYLTASFETGLFQDRLSLLVSIDGLNAELSD